ISINAVTADNVINNVESGQSVQVTGSVGGSAQQNDTVTLTVGNTVVGSGAVHAHGNYSIGVLGGAVAGQTVTATVGGTDAAGSTYSASKADAVGSDTANA